MNSAPSAPELPQISIERNVGWLLRRSAVRWPGQLGVAQPLGRESNGRRRYRRVTFAELDRDSDRIAAGLKRAGLLPGTRIALLVPQSIEFVSTVFGLLKAGLVQILIDPGMGRRNLVRCLAEAEPEAMLAIPAAHAVSWVLGRRFPKLRSRITVGSPRFPGSWSFQRMLETAAEDEAIEPVADATPAAIIFTTGSTGPPKGVLYTHATFRAQVEKIRSFYGIQPGEIDLPGFPLFALFNAAMGVSTVIPDMDPTRPADVDPRLFIETAADFQVTQSFGSPALWNTVGRYCERQSGRPLSSIKRVLSAGAPVPPHVLRRVLAAIHPQGEMHTPYGATEALPVASNSAQIILDETMFASQTGAGTCVGERFEGIEWKVIAIDDSPIRDLASAVELPHGEIGELMVAGEVVTQTYVTRTEANAIHKVRDGDRYWHRMGDVGYLDESDRFWFCGRKSHRVRTAAGTMFTIPCEAIANGHGSIYRSALIGIGEPGSQIPVMVSEPWPERWPASAADAMALRQELAALLREHPLTCSIRHVLLMRKLPVDIRHNSKIFRERLVPWVSRRLRSAELKI